MNAGLGKHGVILDFGFSEGRAIVGDDNKLALASPERLECGAVAQGILPRLHHQSQPVVDALLRLLSLLHGHHPALFLLLIRALSAAVCRRSRCGDFQHTKSRNLRSRGEGKKMLHSALR